MYDKSTDEEAPGPSSNPVELMDDMRRDGLTFKQCVLGRKNNFTAENQVQRYICTDHPKAYL